MSKADKPLEAQEKIESILEAWEEEGKDYILRFSYKSLAIEILRELGYRKPLDRPEICKGCPTFEKGCEGSNQEDCERRDRPELREKLAELEHIQWEYWASSILKDLRKATQAHELGCGCILCKRIQRWENLLNVSYTQLTEAQKDQDRVWADKSLALILPKDKPRSVKQRGKPPFSLGSGGDS